MSRIIHELKHHTPYTVFSAVAAIILIAFFAVAMSAILDDHDEHADAGEAEHDHEGVEGPLGESLYQLFHVFHPVHVLFSATASTAMFWRFDKKLWKAVTIGAVGSLGICAVSDIFFPFVGGVLVGMDMHLHVCLVEHPMIVVPFAAVGIVMGLVTAEVFLDRKSTIYSHSGHIFISTMASLIYLIAFGFHDWMENLFVVFTIIVLAVLLPCCVSDIIFPLLFVKEEDRHKLTSCTDTCHTEGGHGH